jgi:hypothetical protein
MQNSWASKYIYRYDVSFVFMMFWCEIHMIYILTKFMQLLWYNLNKIKRFLCIKYEHSCISLKNNASFIWIFKILNTYKYCSS